MAQSRERRNQRRKQQARPRAAPPTASRAVGRRRTLRRVVIAFLILIGLAGIMTLSATGDDPNGSPVPGFERR